MSKEKNYAVFNISLELDGWGGPFRDSSDFLRKAEWLLPFQSYVPECHVRRDGKLYIVKSEGLHTYEGLFNPNDDHMDLKDPNTGRFFAPGLEITKEGIYLSGMCFEFPFYTLDGLYEARKSGTQIEKINAIIGELEKHAQVRDSEELESMSLTRLKNVYRKRISDQ